MPWKAAETLSDVKRAFLDDHARGVPVADLIAGYGIGRSAAFDLIRRARETSIDEAILVRSRAPLRRPTKFEDDVVMRVVEVCRRFPGLGPKKIHAKLQDVLVGERMPGRSTVAAMMKAHGLTTPSTTKRFIKKPRAPLTKAEAPNDVWAVDHKGLMHLSKTEPLTVVDVYSRMWLCCRPLTDKSYKDTRDAFEALFDEFGVPRVIRVDAGQPWASVVAPMRLTQLSAWWVSLGITIEVVRCPQENGHVERLHRTIKAMDKRITDVRAYFEDQRHWFNEERPHEGIGQRTPAELYVASPRRPAVRTYDYGHCDEVRSVWNNGEIHLGGPSVFISSSLLSYRVGLRVTTSSNNHDVYFYEHHIGTIQNRVFTAVR